jgi:molybdopterin molybdotransferase
MILTYPEALQRVLDSAGRLPARRVSLGDALGLVAAEDVVAMGPVPPFDNSGMDGFAVRASDIESARGKAPARLRVLADLPAGQVASRDVGPGTALRIMTGAPLPPGADTVVPVENTSAAGEEIEVRTPVQRGANVRLAGEDIATGSKVLERGTVLGPGRIGVLAEVGQSGVLVFPRPRVAVVTTGDELVDVMEQPGPGRIRDANLHAVSAQARAFGAVPVPFPRVPDRRDLLARTLREAAATADLVVSTGGVSMGEYDHIRETLESLGGECLFWRVAQKPAGPLGMWRLEGKPVFGVPGNPVAAMIVMEEYVRPLLRRMMGFSRLFRPERQGVLETPWKRRPSDDRLHFLRVRVREEAGRLHASFSGPQGSGILTSMAQANALALVPGTVGEIPAGGPILLHLIEEPEDH